MRNELQYTVCYQLTLANLRCGRVVSTRQVDEHVSSPTAELNELFADLYERFRSPHLLGLQITAIHRQAPFEEQVLG